MEEKALQSPGEIERLEALARKIRGRIITISSQAKTPHLGGALSCVDILTAAYFSFLRVNPSDSDRDRFILSKGHAALAQFVVMAEAGLLSEETLAGFSRPGSPLQEHPSYGSVPGIEASTGSLGHGLPIGVGMALAARIQKRPYRVLVVMSDGECQEGAVWEAALFAPVHQLHNLTVVIDYNKWQATGRSDTVMALHPLAEKWKHFGWRVVEIDGHDMAGLVGAFAEAGRNTGAPTIIVAHTVKGKGASFMQDDNNWHYRIPSESEVEAAHLELGLI
ncbi:MAG: transketolase [Acidobacteria bacterium]|nr:transketolase [Acidobacteriota bacterium]